MSFQAYLDNIKAKTGKTPEDFKKLAAKKNLSKHGEIVAWLKTEFELGHGHANAIAHALLRPSEHKVSANDKIDKLFSGTKAEWRKSYDQLFSKVKKFGKDVDVSCTDTYVSLLRGTKKFAVVQPASSTRLDIGIKRKGAATTTRFESSGSWNAMVTHRVRVGDPKEIDAEILAWLKEAYAAA